MTPLRQTRDDGLLTTAQAAILVGVAPGTIRSWASRKRLMAAGLDERGHPLYSREAVRAAESLVTRNSLRTRHINPRTERGRRSTPAQQAA